MSSEVYLTARAVRMIKDGTGETSCSAWARFCVSALKVSSD